MKRFLGSTALLSCEAVKATSTREKKYPLNLTIFSLTEIISSVTYGFDGMARFVSVQ